MRVTLRKATLGDREFAQKINHQTMKGYVEDLFGEWNVTYQDDRFTRYFKPEGTWVIMRQDLGVGWLKRRETDEEIHLAEIYIAPTHQGLGIGTQILRDLKLEARSKGKFVSLGVLKNNPARQLYEREGFHVIGENNYKLFMECRFDEVGM